MATEPGWPFGGKPNSEQLWSLRQKGRAMEATINTHPHGYEVRVQMGGDVLFSFMHTTLTLAEHVGDTLKRVQMAKGWTDNPPVPD